MKTTSPKFAMRGYILWLLILGSLMSQEMPTIDIANSESGETNIKLNFFLSNPIQRTDIAGWIEQENWFIMNFYHIIQPDSGFTKNLTSYPIQDIQRSFILLHWRYFQKLKFLRMLFFFRIVPGSRKLNKEN